MSQKKANSRGGASAMVRGELDFQHVALEHGYVKARQMLKQSIISVHQNVIKKTDASLFAANRIFRYKEAIRISNTLGAPNSESIIEKIDERSLAAQNITPQNGESLSQAQRIFDMDVALRCAMKSDKLELLLPECELEILPMALGDTLFLQTSFLHGICLPHNNITSILNPALPQVSLYHLRYVRELNLTHNRISILPGDIGALSSLVTLNLSGNRLSTLPLSISRLRALKTLDLTENNFSTLMDELAGMESLENIELQKNLFQAIPPPIVRMKKIKVINMMRNNVPHLAVQTTLLKPEELWWQFTDDLTGELKYVNVLTKETIKTIALYDGAGIARAKDLHTFQKQGTIGYRRRKVWLSACQIHEWDDEEDQDSGQTYYRNNVSGETTWRMPADLDTFGQPQTVTTLSLACNNIKFLSLGMCLLTNLVKVVVHTNKLKDLPHAFGDLVNLEYLDVHNNDISLLPRSFCGCTNLVSLNVSGNQLLRLPELLGTLPRLQLVDAAGNRMTSLPFSLGYCKTLKDIKVAENPLTDPSQDEVNKGLPNLMYYLRQRLMIDNQGMPPPMEYHNMSVMHEITILKPELNAAINKECAIAEKTGFLNMQLMGLTTIPSQLIRMGKKLRKLRLDFNDHLRIPSMPEAFSSLRYLSLRGCKLPDLPENINNLRRCSWLQFNENYIEQLPESITKLRSLTMLDMSNNRLYDLPPSFNTLQQLKTLNLEGNNLELIPPVIAALTVLQVLDVAKNRLTEVPDVLCDLRMLKKLNLEKNRISVLPDRFKVLTLVELKIGHNRVQALPDDLFAHALGRNLKKFSVCENNLLELPSSMDKLDPETTLEADFNPLISPPQYLLAEGLKTVQTYLYVRSRRLAELEELLAEEDFEFNSGAVTPITNDVLDDGTGYLQPLDLAEFDAAVHEYINGEYYKCPASGIELTERIVKLREFRETEIYLIILGTVNAVLGAIWKDKKQRKLYSDAVLLRQQRPWGLHNEMMNVWVLSLNCLIRDTPKNKLVRKDRSSVFSLIEAALPPMPFPFTIDLLKDSLRLYVSPYGQVADTEPVTFPKCDCTGGPKNKPQMHDPCTKSSMVLCVSVYVEEEAERRAVEYDEFSMLFADLESEIRLWLFTEQGKMHLEKEIVRRHRALADDVELREDMHVSELLRLKQAKQLEKEVLARKALFDTNPDDKLQHGFSDIGEAVVAVNEAGDNVRRADVRERALFEQMTDLQALYSKSYDSRKRKCIDDIIEKFSILLYRQQVKYYRIFACYNKLKRPWDGEDGAEFALWMKKLGDKYSKEKLVLAYTNSMGETIPVATIEEYISAEERQNKEQRALEARQAAKKGDDKPEFDWSNTDDMKQYYTAFYSRWRDSRNANVMNQAFNMASELLNEGFSKLKSMMNL